jgi:hypothetical protein
MIDSRMVIDETNVDWSALGEMLRVNSRARGRGDYWHWKNKQEKETDAAKQVLTIAGHEIVDLRTRQAGQDPPDCEAFVDGKRCGIEVSELVDRITLEASIRGCEQHRAWTREDFCLEIQNRINRKDSSANVTGGPYQSYFLVLVTDDLYCLNRENVSRFLSEATFQARLITDAFLGLSFHPEIEGKGSCPIFKLALVPRSRRLTNKRPSVRMNVATSFEHARD